MKPFGRRLKILKMSNWMLYQSMMTEKKPKIRAYIKCILTFVPEDDI